MNVPMEWSTRGLSRRDAERALALTERLLKKVDCRWPRALACRVTVEREPWETQAREIEAPVRVWVELTLPSRPPMVAVRRPDEGCPGESIESAVHAAFRRVMAQLDLIAAKTTKRAMTYRSASGRRTYLIERWI